MLKLHDAYLAAQQACVDGPHDEPVVHRGPMYPLDSLREIPATVTASMNAFGPETPHFISLTDAYFGLPSLTVSVYTASLHEITYRPYDAQHHGSAFLYWIFRSKQKILIVTGTYGETSLASCFFSLRTLVRPWYRFSPISHETATIPASCIRCAIVSPSTRAAVVSEVE